MQKWLIYVIGICVALSVIGIVFFQPPRSHHSLDENSDFHSRSVRLTIDDQISRIKPVVDVRAKSDHSSLLVQTMVDTPPKDSILLHESLQDLLNRVKTSRNEVIISAATYMYREFLYNWLCSVRNAGLIKHVIVYTMDQRLASELVQLHDFNTVYFDYENSFSKRNVASILDNRNSQKFTLAKTMFIEKILVEYNMRVLVAHNDAVWLRDPLKFLNKDYLNMDLVAQNDVENLFSPPKLCDGFLYLNNTSKMKEIWSELVSTQKEMSSRGDQEVNEQSLINSKQRLRRLKYGILPWAQFPSGAMFFGSKDLKRFVNLHVVHNNWVALELKKKRFIEREMWLLDQKYRCRPQDPTLAA